MNKKQIIIGTLLSLVIASCSTQIPVNTQVKSADSSVSKNMKSGVVSLNFNPQNKKFGIKGVNFSNTAITKLKLDINGSGMTTVSQTVNYTVGQTVSFNLVVPVGTNRILSLYALDKNDSVISTLQGAVDVLPNQTNNAKISFFDTVLGQILSNILSGSNPSVLSNINLANLRTSLVNFTGYDEVNNKFSKIDPVRVDSVSIASYMSTNNGAFPPDNFANAQGLGTVNLTSDQTGVTIMVNDLSSAAVQTTTLNSTSVQNVSPGMWKVTVMKNGSQSMTSDVKVTAGQTTNLTMNLTGSKIFTADLTGTQEVPATNSTATATGSVMLNDDNTATVSIKLNSALGSVQTDAHIHGPAATGTNASVLFPFTTPSGAKLLGSFSGFKITLTPTQVQQMRDGLFYFNMHSTNFPGGEIRGQIMPSGGAVMPFNKLVYGVDTNNMLVSFNATTPNLVTKVAITGLQTGENILGIDFRAVDGLMYALGSSNRMYTINGTTGVATAIGASAFSAPALSGVSFGVDFNPVPDRFRVHSEADQNLRLNQLTGANAATDTTLAYKTADVNVAANPNIVATAYTNSLPFAGTTTLYAIDSNLDTLVTLDNPNDGQLTTVGALGVNTTDNAGMDIDGETGRAYAVLSTSATSSGFYSITPATGVATLLGAINNDAALRTIAIKP